MTSETIKRAYAQRETPTISKHLRALQRCLLLNINISIQQNTSLMLRLQALKEHFTQNTTSTITSFGYQSIENQYSKGEWLAC